MKGGYRNMGRWCLLDRLHVRRSQVFGSVLLILGVIMVSLGASPAGAAESDGAAGSNDPADNVAGKALPFDEWIADEQTWIASTVLPSGTFPTGGRIVPYFANFTTYALSLSAEYAPLIKGHLQWYLTHLERPDRFGISGTVYDYEVFADGEERSKEDYDSSDSYGATFFSALRRYYDLTRDQAFVQQHRAELDLIAGAVLATEQADGLTWAKPTWKVKYLMDNAEVAQGLNDLAYLMEAALGDKAAAETYRKKAGSVLKGIDRVLWQGNRYAMGVDAAGRAFPFDWSKWYPDATSQLFPIWLGILNPRDSKAIGLYKQFNQAHPDWVKLAKDDPFPWAMVGYTAAVMGDVAQATEYITNVRRAYVELGERSWPWHPTEASFYVLTLDLLLQVTQAYFNEKI